MRRGGRSSIPPHWAYCVDCWKRTVWRPRRFYENVPESAKAEVAAHRLAFPKHRVFTSWEPKD